MLHVGITTAETVTFPVIVAAAQALLTHKAQTLNKIVILFIVLTQLPSIQNPTYS